MLFSLIFIGGGTIVVVASLFRFLRPSLAAAPQWDLPEPLTAARARDNLKVSLIHRPPTSARCAPGPP